MPLNFSTGRKPLTAFSLASLTDIVLLLLIFFLLTSSFVTQRGIEVNLPDTASATPLEAQYVAISILPDGRLFVDETETTPDSLAITLAQLKGDRDAVAVYADREAMIGSLAAVAGAAAELDMRVSVATEPGSGE
ncbi:MAG TPA: biopolymer transporter ExbD [Bacteroidetes bacterium]|nr:biopolymer transporter ExbD [Bacteroidota bacterium]HIL57004.1 biopolymer transporter ExbD [Rhodothermales bacterium]